VTLTLLTWRRLDFRLLKVQDDFIALMSAMRISGPAGERVGPRLVVDNTIREAQT